MSAAGVKSANYNMRMDPQTKSSAESLFRELGMTLPQAVNMFIARALSVGGMPFDLKMPRYNRETEETMQEAIDIGSGKVKTRIYNSADELFDELDKEFGSS